MKYQVRRSTIVSDFSDTDTAILLRKDAWQVLVNYELMLRHLLDVDDGWEYQVGTLSID